MLPFPTTRLSLLTRLRNLDDHQAWYEFVTPYPINFKAAEVTTDATGSVRMTAWKLGEAGSVFFEHQGDSGSIDFEFGTQPKVSLRLK
jgi:hypothetical protein